MGVASGMVWGLQLHEGAHLVFEVSARDVKQVQQASHVIVLEAREQTLGFLQLCLLLHAHTLY